MGQEDTLEVLHEPIQKTEVRGHRSAADTFFRPIQAAAMRIEPIAQGASVTAEPVFDRSSIATVAPHP
jgi:hypothetical protein